MLPFFKRNKKKSEISREINRHARARILAALQQISQYWESVCRDVSDKIVLEFGGFYAKDGVPASNTIYRCVEHFQEAPDEHCLYFVEFALASRYFGWHDEINKNTTECQ